MLHCTTIGGLLSALDKLERLTRQQRKLLSVLTSRRGYIVSRDTIIDQLYADREDGGPDNPGNVISVVVASLRRAGFPIITHHSRGLQYAPEWIAKPTKRKARRAAA